MTKLFSIFDWFHQAARARRRRILIWMHKAHDYFESKILPYLYVSSTSTSSKRRLAENGNRNKYILLTNRDMWHTLRFQIIANKYSFDIVKEFIYPGSTVTSKNDVGLKIKCRITLVNSVLSYGAKVWTLLVSDEEALGVFAKKTST